MFKQDSVEASLIVNRMLTSLLAWAPTRGRAGSDLRTAIGDTIANSQTLCLQDKIGAVLANCFDLARICGIILPQLGKVRTGILSENPVTLGAILIKNVSVGICIATEAHVLADTTFVSRDDSEKVKATFNDVFNQFEEVAADDMDQMSYQATVNLHAAITFFLVETARPLPRMIGYRFAQPIPSLYAAYRLYNDAGRADELRNENHVVHPAFSPMKGRALSA